jgi:hypothetical protein
MSNPYRYPEVGHVYRHCVMCRRPFRVCNAQLARRSAKFCTVKSYHAALHAFSEALAGDRLGLILGRTPQKVKGTLAEPGDVWGGGRSDKEEAEETTYCTSRPGTHDRGIQSEREQPEPGRIHHLDEHAGGIEEARTEVE